MRRFREVLGVAYLILGLGNLGLSLMIAFDVIPYKPYDVGPFWKSIQQFAMAFLLMEPKR